MTIEELGAARSEFTLATGLTGVVFERPNAPVHVRLAFKAGTRFDPIGKEGTAHFLEHMITAGTKRFPTKTVFANHVERYGGNFGASTPMESMYLNVTVGDPTDVEVAFDTLGQMMTESLFTASTLENERQAVLGEIGNWHASPVQIMVDARYRLFFAGTANGRTLVGLPEVTKQLQTDDLKAFLKDVLTAERGLIVASGGVTGKHIEALAAKYLSHLPQTGIALVDGELPEHRTDPVLIEHRDNNQIHMTLGFRIPPINNPDQPALEMLATIIGGGRASSLSRIMREEQGLVYSVQSAAQSLNGGGMFITVTTVDKSKLQRALDAIISEYQRLATIGPTEEEVAFAVEKKLKSLRMQLQTSSDWVDFHTHRLLWDTYTWTAAQYADDLSKLTCEDLRAAAANHFRAYNWYAVMVGNIERDDFQIQFL